MESGSVYPHDSADLLPCSLLRNVAIILSILERTLSCARRLEPQEMIMTDQRKSASGGQISSTVPAGAPEPEGLSVQERNKAVIRQYFDRCWNQNDIDFVDTIMAPDYDLHFDDGPGGREVWKESVRWFRQIFPVIHFNVLSLIAEGDMVAVRSEWTATQAGEFMGLPSKGRTFVARNADFYQLRDGKMIGHWDVNDMLSIVSQLDVLPDDVSRIHPLFRRRGWPADAAKR